MAGQIVSGQWGWIGYAVGAAAILFTYLRDRKKNDIEESSLILNQWKLLVDGHKEDIAAIKTDFAAYKSAAITEIASLRERLTAVEKDLAEQRLYAAKEIAARDVQIAGLQRAIAQNSKSTVFRLGKSDTRMDDMDTTNLAQHGEMQDHIDRLDAQGDNSRGRNKDLDDA